MNYKEIKACRICGNYNLTPILSLGDLFLTSVFPKTKEEYVVKAPLDLVKCEGSPFSCCNLVQLKHTVDRKLLYGDNYGYKSSLNPSMVKHLKEIVDTALDYVKLKKNDVVVDIGSNDCTLLKLFPKCKKIGIDPIGKFFVHYPKDVEMYESFFEDCKNFVPKAKVITSIAMLYDLEDPLRFFFDVKDCLTEDGIWITEQSYFPLMVQNSSFDTICHEHLEYYCIQQIRYMADIAGLKIIEISVNETNGGSFQVVMCKKENRDYPEELIDDMFVNLTTNFYEGFSKRVNRIKKTMQDTLRNIPRHNLIFGYGASTKGNVILQYCGIDHRLISTIGEVNKEKWGCFTPGTHIPIISEEEAKKMKPDFFLVLPWHFKDFIIKKEKLFIKNGGKFIFPIPYPTIFG